MDDDFDNMACAPWMAALSARADGEDTGVDERILVAHLKTCPACRSFADDVGGLRRNAAIREAPDMPDLAPRVSKLNAMADRASHWTLVRALLALVAALILGLSLPALVLGREESTSEHAARHLGAFTAAYAMALLVVVVRPARARSILPVAVVLAGALMITAAVDVLDGHIPLVEETAHLPELVSVVLVWMVARPLGGPAGRRTGQAGSQPPLVLLPPETTGAAPESESG